MACPHCDRTFQVLVVLIFLGPKYTCWYLLCFWQPPSNNAWSFSRWRASSDLTWQHTRQEPFIDLSPVSIVIRPSRNNMTWQGISGEGSGLHHMFIFSSQTPQVPPWHQVPLLFWVWWELCGWNKVEATQMDSPTTQSLQVQQHFLGNLHDIPFLL